MTEPAPLIVIRDGVPVRLGSRAAQMVRAIVDSQDEIEQQKSGLIELHYGPCEVQATMKNKLGFWKVN